ncbi:MAG: DUF4982 domain-containing protein [Prevotella sp.]|nr:DUF4982 domain-containing protein [Prevotella sp.]
MRRFSMLTSLLFGLVLTVSAHPIPRKLLFNDNWLFCLNDSDFTHSQAVTLPHDWSIRQAFDRKAPAGNDGGYLPTGRGWYKKTFTLGVEHQGKRLRLYFEGIYMNAHVYVNGQLAGGWPYGYTSFWVDVTKFVHQGQNEVIVSVDNSQQKNCRWYSGSGIYRNVWLYTTPMSYIDEWSVCVTNPDPHTVNIKADVVGEQGNRTPIERTIHIENPQLWSPAHPYLYEAELSAGDDRLSISYGLRTISYDAQQGLLLNGQPLRLNGACLHHDNGILGAAAFDVAERRKVELMKAAGFNAVRTSHNPPSEAFLRACDELGLLVIDEAFDGWREQKNAHDYHELIDQWWQRDLGAMIRRDRNHPSIFCWSIGNEVIERKKIEVVKTAHQMAALCHELDPQRRPVTSALAAWDNDWDIYDPLAAEHDIVGYNYMIHKSESDHQRLPNRVMMQTESYPRDAWKNFQKVMNEPYVIGDFVWTGLDYIGESGIGRWYYEKRRMGNDMSGKGDVPGEHYERPLYPWHAAYCGDVDLTGLRKPISHYRSMLWHSALSANELPKTDQPEEQLFMAVREPDGYHGKIKETLWGTWPTFESWNWPGHEGKPIEVEVYTKHPSAKLFLNNQLVGEQATSEMKAVFTLPYATGTLRAEAAGQQVELHTAGEPIALRLTADRTMLAADKQDLCFITIELIDKDGRVNPTANNLLTATVKGAATLQAFGNADIKDEDAYFDNAHHAWHGRALLVVRSNGKRGTTTITVEGKGLKKQRLTINSPK